MEGIEKDSRIGFNLIPTYKHSRIFITRVKFPSIGIQFFSLKKNGRSWKRFANLGLANRFRLSSRARRKPFGQFHLNPRDISQGRYPGFAGISDTRVSIPRYRLHARVRVCVAGFRVCKPRSWPRDTAAIDTKKSAISGRPFNERWRLIGYRRDDGSVAGTVPVDRDPLVSNDRAGYFQWARTSRFVLFLRGSRGFNWRGWYRIERILRVCACMFFI